MANQNENTSALRKRIATDPAFERTRENMAEFERAGKASKLLSDTFRVVAGNASDKNMISRLTKQMSKVIKGDSISDRGQRNVVNGDILQLNGFEFNNNGKLATVFFAPYTSTIDRAAGTLTIDIPAFVPKRTIKAPPNTTHFMLESAAAEIDFGTDTQVVANAATAELLLDGEAAEAISLSHAVTANSTHPLFLVLGIRFYQQLNNKFYQLNNGRFNALAIIKIDAPAPAAG